jgi:hypothetical protein
MTGRTRRPPKVQTLHFQKLVRAPLDFVYRCCTDYREDDDRITDSIYQYKAKIVLREPNRVVRIITVPGADPNRCTDVEVIRLRPPNRWRLTKLSWTDDETGSYRLTAKDPHVTLLEMRFRRTWKAGPLPRLDRYRALFNRTWDRYVEVIETEYDRWTRRHPRARTV